VAECWKIDPRENRDDKLRFMGSEDNRRSDEHRDRRAHGRGGRRDGDQKKPWYMRRRLWLATASLLYVGWRRITGRPRKATDAGNDVAA
jgi:hypothetical protein